MPGLSNIGAVVEDNNALDLRSDQIATRCDVYLPACDEPCQSVELDSLTRNQIEPRTQSQPVMYDRNFWADRGLNSDTQWYWPPDLRFLSDLTWFELCRSYWNVRRSHGCHLSHRQDSE